MCKFIMWVKNAIIKKRTNIMCYNKIKFVNKLGLNWVNNKPFYLNLKWDLSHLTCMNCTDMCKSESFVHPTTGRFYKKIKKKVLACDSSYVFYILWCPCKLLYVGETKNDIKTRINQHCYSIRKKCPDLSVPKHFMEADHTRCEFYGSRPHTVA